MKPPQKARSVFQSFKCLLYRPFDEKMLNDDAANRFDWMHAIPFASIHFGCLLVFWAGWCWLPAATAVAMYVGRFFAITAFYPRFLSHRTFTTSRILLFFFRATGCS